MDKKARGGVVGGLILVVIGVLALVGQFLPAGFGEFFGTFLLLALAAIFLVAGIITRQSGFFIPAGILGGLGAAVAVQTSSLVTRVPMEDGALFLIIFGLGWFTIPILSAIFTQDRHWWAFIPGAIIALVGLSVAYGGLFNDALNLLNYVWPVALIVLGGWVLWRVRHPKEEAPEEKLVEKHS